MTSPSHESAPVQEALFEITQEDTDRLHESVWQSIGYDKPFQQLSHDEKMALGRVNAGGDRTVEYYRDHTAYEIRSGGAPSNALTDEQKERAQAVAATITHNVDRHWRRALEAGDAGDHYGFARNMLEVDKINRRRRELGKTAIPPSLEALPEYEIDSSGQDH